MGLEADALESMSASRVVAQPYAPEGHCWLHVPALIGLMGSLSLCT